MGCHCNKREEYGLRREKTDVAAKKMMQYGLSLSLALASSFTFQYNIQFKYIKLASQINKKYKQTIIILSCKDKKLNTNSGGRVMYSHI